MTDHYLELRNVTKKFSGFTLENISFDLPKGYIMGLVGANGAGKTTTIKLILNMLEKNSGQISVFGLDSVNQERQIKQEIGVVFDSVIYVDAWSVKDTENSISIFYDSWSHDTFKQMTECFGLLPKMKVKEMSRGMQLKLMLACAFSHNARLLILDEPTSGLDPAARDELLEILQDYIRDGERSVLFSTHITADLERIADYVTCLDKGKLFFTGSIDKLLDSYRIIKGRPEKLTPDLRRKIIGLRQTSPGFEGLLEKTSSLSYKDYILDNPSIDDIIVCISRQEERL